MKVLPYILYGEAIQVYFLLHEKSTEVAPSKPIKHIHGLPITFKGANSQGLLL